MIRFFNVPILHSIYQNQISTQRALIICTAIFQNSKFVWGIEELGVHNFSILLNDLKLHYEFSDIGRRIKTDSSIGDKNFLINFRSAKIPIFLLYYPCVQVHIGRLE